MKVVSWNVNGLRASLRSSGKNLKAFLESLEADIICFQETKAQRDQLDSSTYLAEGYNGYFSFCQTKGGYSGVVTFCRNSAAPVRAEEGLSGVLSAERGDAVRCYGEMDEFTSEELSSLDGEGRAVLTEHLIQDSEGHSKNLVIINVYCPMADRENQERIDYKLRFYSLLQKRCTALERSGKLVIALGDFNCSREVIDSAYLQEDPTLLLGGSPTKEWMQQFAITNPSSPHPSSSTNATQLVDTFRYLHPTQEKAYSCWQTLIDARKTNYGTRIDYILASRDLAKSLSRAEVWQHVEGSDHCPVFAEFAVSFVSSSNQSYPSLCSHHFSAGKQRNLFQFLSSSSSSSSSSTSGGKEPGKIVPPPSMKRNRSVDEGAPAAKMRKRSSVDQGGSSKQSLLSFIKPKQSKAENPPLLKNDETKSETVSEETNISQSQPSTGYSERLLQDQSSSSSFSSSQPSSQSSGSTKLSQEWKSVFSGRPKPPLCKGHNEPCVLRTVKKQGPNRLKQFWVCARPGGSKDDPQARCDFFEWKKKK